MEGELSAPTMSIIVPTRGRPQNVDRLVEWWHDTCLEETELIFCVGIDDPSYQKYLDKFNSHKGLRNLEWMSKTSNYSLVSTLNYAAITTAMRLCHPPTFIGFMGDDHVPRTYGWDAQIIDSLEHNQIGISYGNDMIQSQNLPTAVFMSAAIVNRLGYMCPPTLEHLYIDNVWKAWGEALGILSYLPETIIEHMHPIARKVDWDAQYERVNAGEQYARDKIAYDSYMQTTFHDDIHKLRTLIK